MTESLGSLLSKRNMDEPPEVQVIKTFVYAQYQVTPEVTVQPSNIIISVKG